MAGPLRTVTIAARRGSAHSWRTMKRWVNFIIAERSVVTIILVNTAALLAMGFTVPGTQAHEVASWVDYGCVVYFSLETILKISTQGWKQYWSSGWNRFDFWVVLISCPILLKPMVELEALTAVLALRLGRLFRLFRVLRFIPNRDHLYLGIKRALRASVGVFLALLVINVVLSLGATQLFGKYAPEHFGDPLTSSYSLFRIFTIEGWYEIPDAIAERAPAAYAVLARVYFVGSVIIGGILGFSLANAVFVDEMTMDNTDEIERKVEQLLNEVRQLRTELGQTSDKLS